MPNATALTIRSRGTRCQAPPAPGPLSSNVRYLGMASTIPELLAEATSILNTLSKAGKEGKVERATHLVQAFIEAVKQEPNSSGIGKAVHALSWHLADQLDPLPESLKICELSSHGRRLEKALSEKNT